MNAGLYVYNGPSRPPRRSVVGQVLDGLSAASLDSELIEIVVLIGLMLAFTAACIFVP